MKIHCYIVAVTGLQFVSVQNFILGGCKVLSVFPKSLKVSAKTPSNDWSASDYFKAREWVTQWGESYRMLSSRVCIFFIPALVKDYAFLQMYSCVFWLIPLLYEIVRGGESAPTAFSFTWLTLLMFCPHKKNDGISCLPKFKWTDMDLYWPSEFWLLSV